MANNEDIAKSIANALQASPAKTSTPTGVMTESLKATKLAEEAQAQSAAEDAAFMEERRKRQQAEVISGTTALPDLAGGLQAASNVKRKPYVDLGEPAPAFGPAAGAGYDAIRDDSISPAQQLGSGAVISDSPNAYPHMGGIVSPGREIYAELPKTEDTFYLKAKYRPITPKPIRMFDGSEFTTNTDNMQKAMYQFIVGVKGVKDLDWAGYRMLGPKQEESWAQSFFRSIANSVPQMVVGMAQGTVSLGNDIANLIDLMFHDDKYSKQINAIYNANAAAINEASYDLYQSLRIDYTDITERDTKKSAVMLGNVPGSVAPAILGGPNTLAALALSEGLSGYAGIRNSLRDAGYSPLEAFGMALGGGLAIAGLSYASDWFIDDVQKVLTKSGTSLIKEALYNPKGLAKVVRNVGLKKTLMEAGSEVMQEDIQRLFSGESFGEVYTTQWDERLNIAVGSLLFGLGAAYYQAVKLPAQGERTKKYLESVEALLASNKNVFEQFINEGIITEESVDAIFAALRNPEAGAAVADIIKDTVIQQFDKIPVEQIQKLQKILDGIDPNLELDKEFGALNERVDALLVNSNLSAEQKTTVRNFMRGVAAWQLSTMGVLPSQMQLPQSITSERPKGVPASASGWTSPDGSVIYISTGSTAPLATTQITAGRGSGNLAMSRKVGSDISKAARKGAGNLNQSIDVGLTKHELTHWAEKFTGLKNVVEFANAMSKLVSTIIPNYTKGKSGVELSEAFAYAMQYAGNQAKEAIGLAGPVQDHVNFMNSMLRANQSAGRITAELKAYFDVLQKVLSTNSQLIDQVLEEWKSPEALRSAIREFIETGDASVLSVDTLRNLSAVLNSVVNGETQDKLATVFESSEQMQEFKDTANGIKTKQSEKDRIEKADKRDQLRAEANSQVGLPEKTKPTAAPTVSEAASEIATEDVELPKAETKAETTKAETKAEAKTETKTEDMPERRKKSGEMYDIDELEVGKMSDQKLVNYRIHVAKWLSAEQASGVAPASRISALQRYNELSAAEVAKRKKAKRFTPEQAQALEDEGLYAVFEVQPLYTEKITDALAEIVVEERTPAEQDLYRALARYEADSNFYKDYEFVSQYEANTRLISLAEELDAKISLISADPKSRAQSYINTLEKRIAYHIQFLEDQNHDILMNEMLVADGILEPDYAGTTDDRTRAQKQYDKEIGLAEAIESDAKGLKEASAAKLESLKKTVADLKVAMSRSPKIAKKRVDAALASLNTELLGEADPAMIDFYARVLDFANRLSESDSPDRLSSIITSLEKEIRNIERSLKDEGSIYRFYDATAKAERIRQGAERRLESAKNAPRRSTGRLSYYFTPKYDSDYSSRMMGAQTVDSAYAFLKSGQGSEAERVAAEKVTQQNRVLASYANPARAFGKRPLLDTPSPLEEMGISVEEALQTIANAGLKPYELDVSQITDDFIGKSYNLEESAPMTRSRIYAKLIDFMLHEDFGMKDIAESGDDAQMMRVLLAIHEAKYLANDMFAQYLGREQSFDKHPSLHPISPATIDFAKSERGQAQMKDHMQNRGYSEVTLAHMLEEGDHVAFPYGNNYFRGIISFKGKTPSGATTYVIRRDIDVAEWKDKELTPKTRGLEEYVIGAEEFYKVGILRKPVRSIDTAHIKEVFDFYDSAFEKIGRTNMTKLAVASRTNEDADIFDAIDPIKREIAEEMSALDSPTDGLFAVVPTIDPGVFAVIGGSLEDTMAAYERSMELEEEYEESGLWYEGKAEQEAILAAELARREDMLKPKFSDAVTKKNERGVSFIDQLDMLEKGLAETRVSKALYFLGSGSGTDRKGRLLFGKVWDKAFGLSKAYSYAQQRREMRVHLMDEVVVKDVFGGNQKAYDKWRAEIKADRYDAVVNGNNVKISRDEIMSIYAMKLESERPGSSNNQLSRLRKYSNIDGLIANLTAEDKKFVEKAIVEIRAAREGISSVPTDWVPAVEMTTFVKDGWAGRKKSKINNERGFVESDTSIAALGLYDSTISSISRFATHASGLMAQLDNLKQILAFAGVDKSMYREFEGEDQKLYDDILNRSVRLREAIAKKIGHTQAKWLLQGIEYDLTADPLSDDIGTAPGMEWFHKLTRGAAASAMSLNLRQALQNLGNYHRFFGLSSSGGIKFYTADWVNAVAHIKEAWALAMENPEFKRRFEQAGLSEHMRRIADVNQPSFLSEIQTKLFEKGKDGASDVVGTLNSLSAIGTKWGLATNVLPDMVGIALGNYAVWNDVLAKNGGNVAEAQKEIADFVNNRISSSNYMTQSLLKKRLNKMGLGALVMFQSDQLQSFGALAEAWSTLLNSKDAGERSMAKRDIASFVVSMGRYIAIKAGWVGALMAAAMGRDLSDDEWDYIYESTAYELVAQMGGWSQFNNLGISPFIRSLMEGENFGPSVVTVSATGRLISDVRKGFKGDGMSFVDALGEALALSGIAPAFPALLRISDGIFKIASGDENESAVGWKQVTGTSETGAMKQLGLSKSQKTGKIQPKKKLKKDGE